MSIVYVGTGKMQDKYHNKIINIILDNAVYQRRKKSKKKPRNLTSTWYFYRCIHPILIWMKDFGNFCEKMDLSINILKIL